MSDKRKTCDGEVKQGGSVSETNRGGADSCEETGVKRAKLAETEGGEIGGGE